MDGDQDLACIQSTVNNAKTLEMPVVSYVTAGIAGAALVFSGVSAVGAVVGAGASSGAPGAGAPSPSFGEVIGWLQTISMNGMLSVDYPPIYRSFTKNFAFSGGLIPWERMQVSIDDFRGVTGGNLTRDSVAHLRNSTLVYKKPGRANETLTKRGLDGFFNHIKLVTRQIETSVNGTELIAAAPEGGNATAPVGDGKNSHLVDGIQAYVEELRIPQSNTFMTVLLAFAVVIAAIAVGILLFKLILELWSLFGSFPKSLTGFRKRYWGLMARTIVNLILVLYGVWTLYCIFQFTHGDSWAAKALAGVTLAAFTGILGFFTFRIWQLARRHKKSQGDASALFDDKDTWRRYSLFYDQYKKNLWWIFVPTIVYMFAKGCIIAAADGHGLTQATAQLVVEALMLALLVWHRPYVTKSGNWINMFIQVVRVLSVVCILVFVEELGVAQTTKTVTGVVLITVQSVLTGALAILIAVNAIIVCCRENPHRRRRKEAGERDPGPVCESEKLTSRAEKMNRDLDNLTPLDPRNSLLMEPTTYKNHKGLVTKDYSLEFEDDHESYPRYRDETPDGRRGYGRPESRERLVPSAADMPYVHGRSLSRESDLVDREPLRRQPTVPDVGYR